MASAADPFARMLTRSFPFVPLAVIESGWPSPAPPPIALSRSNSTLVMSVPVRSPTTALSGPPSAWVRIRSTSSRSILMLATSRRNSTRGPLAETSKFSATPAPLNSMMSLPAWPSIVSLPSPGSQRNESSPAPRRPRSSPRLPSMASLPSPPRSISEASLPLIVSLPAPPSTVTLISAARPRPPLTVSFPPRALTTSESFAASECSTFTAVLRPVTSTAPALAAMLMLSLPLVALTMTVSAAPSPALPPSAPRGRTRRSRGRSRSCR